MNICGLLIHAHPAQAAAVRSAIESRRGAAVHAVTDDGRLIVTVEDDQDADAGETVLALHNLPGVLSAAIVYHHFEPDADAPASSSAPEIP